jgi:6-phosphofructokinase 1
VPEVPFTLHGFLAALRARLREKSHAVVLLAEGAGQDLLEAEEGRDRSGNVKLSDIGTFLRDTIKARLPEEGVDASVKYIDPSYSIRSMPANARDSAFCLLLGHNAVHAGMAGRTNMVVGFWRNRFTHVPIPAATDVTKRIEPEGRLWSAVLAATGQPREM